MQNLIVRMMVVNIRRATLVFMLLFFNISNTLAQNIQQIMPNYRNADIRQIVEAVGEITGRNFLVDPRVTGSVTLLSYTPMSPEDPELEEPVVRFRSPLTPLTPASTVPTLT